MTASTVPFHRQWTTADASGHPQLDAEHRALIDSVDEIAHAIAERRDAPAVFALLEAVVHDCIAHFASEDAVFRQAATQEAESHIQKHRELAEKMQNLLRHASDGSMASMEMVAALLYDPLVIHMVSEDQKLYPQLRAKVPTTRR